MREAKVEAPPDSVHPKSRAAWRRWLEKNHGRKTGVWFVSWRSASGKPRIPYESVIEEALCFGWIDGPGRVLDEERAVLRFAPRRARSGWSKKNKDRIARLIRTRRMAAPGLARIAAAKKDGSWAALDAVEAMTVPADLRRALRAAQGATSLFAAFPPSARKAILGWIAAAKTPETRARRVAETARLAAKNERANQWPRPPR